MRNEVERAETTSPDAAHRRPPSLLSARPAGNSEPTPPQARGGAERQRSVTTAVQDKMPSPTPRGSRFPVRFGARTTNAVPPTLREYPSRTSQGDVRSACGAGPAAAA